MCESIGPRGRARPLATLLAGVLLATVSACGSTDHSASSEPAIILISLDTLRADMLGAHGYREHPTSPFLDSLARDAVVCEIAIVQEPWTLTSHMSLLTGLYPQNHGVHEETPLRARIPTLQGLLQEQDIATRAFVAGGYLDERWGFDRGFYEYVGDRIRPSSDLKSRAIAWLEDNASSAFFLFPHTYDVHSLGDLPFYESPEPFRGSFTRTIDSELAASEAETFRTLWEPPPQGELERG